MLELDDTIENTGWLLLIQESFGLGGASPR